MSLSLWFTLACLVPSVPYYPLSCLGVLCVVARMRVLVLLPFGLSLLRVVTVAAGSLVGLGDARFKVAVVQLSLLWVCVKVLVVLVMVTVPS